MIVVVAAVIEENDAFLVTRRQEGVHLAGMWEFPGGKLHPPETHADALRRELKEELDVEIDMGDLLYNVTHGYDDRALSLYFYACRLRGVPRPMVGQGMRWVPRAELASLGFPPADEALIRQLTESGVR